MFSIELDQDLISGKEVLQEGAMPFLLYVDHVHMIRSSRGMLGELLF